MAFRPIGRKEIAAALLDGRGDIAAASLTVTPERLAQFDFSNPTSKNVSEIVVSGPASQPIAAADDLSGREVFVRTSSMTNAGLVPYVVVEDFLARFCANVLPAIQLHPEVALLSGADVAWAMWKGSPLLKAELETVTYVSNIYKYYVAYKLVMETQEERRKDREKSGG